MTDSAAESRISLGALEFERPSVMGILNVTPDSFSDGGRFDRLDAAVSAALTMVEQGASIIDVGGESTRPGADDVPVEVEIERVVPVIDAIRGETACPVSVDTSKAEVMQAAVAAGASMINDVRALREPGALETAAALGVPVCLMHMQGAPRTMQHQPRYADVVKDVIQFLGERLEACEAAGIDRDRVVIDPGFGFGKTVRHNMALLARLGEFRQLGQPILAGLSRKSSLGALTGREVGERMPASIAAATIAALNGADILRVHDVAETEDALKVAAAVRDAGRQPHVP